MFEIFPANYVWNLSTNLAMCMGAPIGEIEEACRPVINASTQGDDAGTELFFRSWTAVADKLVGLAEEDEISGRLFSAGAKYGRASTYYLTAERMQSRQFKGRAAAYRKMLNYFMKSVNLGGENCERVEIPYQGTFLVGYFVKAQGAEAKAPCMCHFNGLDSTKEMVYRVGIAQELSRRGISTLIVDQPGVGEALRLQGLTAFPESEVWAAACIDYLELRDDVDSKRIGIIAWSLGGYYAPRAAAFEPRFALCVAWGANYNWGEVQKRRLAREGDQPVPHYWEHVQWVWGQDSLEEFMAFSAKVSLVGILDRIKVPFLICHGENDRQIPLEYAHATYNDAVNSPHRELKIFTAREGGVEHCNADNMCNARDYVADWVAKVFGARTR